MATQQNVKGKVYVGQIVHAKSFYELEVLANGYIAVRDDGKIFEVGTALDNEWQERNADFELVCLGAEQFLMPGFVDAHIHAPQVAQIGLGLDMPLLEWLNTYTFPLEAKFADLEFAEKVYKRVVESTIKCGTTLASYFGTNNTESTVILAQEVARQGQRALVGKVCSDCNSPDFYVETTEESIIGTQNFIDAVRNIPGRLVKPTITPRFALSCSKELLKELGDIARRLDLRVQSHISESVAEIKFVEEIFQCSYAEAYDKAGLLTKKTVMAHGVHLEDAEIQLLKKRGTSVAHCPASNTVLSSGFCDIIRLIKNGVKVGLGTDVSGGNSISIQDAILRALDVSHHLEFVKKQDMKGVGSLAIKDFAYKPIDYKQAIFLATLGGAEALALDKVTGNFVEGKEFDALLIDTSVYPLHNYGMYDEETYACKTAETKLMEMVQKFIYVGDDRNIIKVFVAGHQIK